jgi:hypothetical protein
MAVARARINCCVADASSASVALSLWRYSPAAVLVAILIADSNRRTDPDLWGHLRFGQMFIAG